MSQVCKSSIDNFCGLSSIDADVDVNPVWLGENTSALKVIDVLHASGRSGKGRPMFRCTDQMDKNLTSFGYSKRRNEDITDLLLLIKIR